MQDMRIAEESGLSNHSVESTSEGQASSSRLHVSSGVREPAASRAFVFGVIPTLRTLTLMQAVLLTALAAAAVIVAASGIWTIAWVAFAR